MSVPFVKFHATATKLAAGVFANALNADTDVLKAYLSNTAPNVATHDEKADIAEIAIANGYAGAVDIQNAATTTAGVITVVATDFVVTASGGTVGPFRYVLVFDDTVANDPLLGYYDYGSPITLQDGETFTVDFGASLLTLG